jgi:hypothetical protein
MLPALYSFTSKYPILLSFLPTELSRLGYAMRLWQQSFHVAFEAHPPQSTLLCLTRPSHMPLGFVLRDLGCMHIHPQIYTNYTPPLVVSSPFSQSTAS